MQRKHKIALSVAVGFLFSAIVVSVSLRPHAITEEEAQQRLYEAGRIKDLTHKKYERGLTDVEQEEYRQLIEKRTREEIKTRSGSPINP